MSDLQVIFGTGPIGLAVMNELVARGKHVRMVNRSGKAAVPDGVDVLRADASVPALTRELCRGASVVYNCTNPPYDKWPTLFPALQEGILEGAASGGAKLVVMDNLYMYGPTGGQRLTEDLPYAARYAKGIVRAKMAESLFDAHRSGRVRATSGRASDYFGPGAGGSAMGDNVFGRAVAGKAAQVLGDPDLPHTYSYVPDIGRALVILGERDEALGEAWHLPGPRTVTTREIVALVFNELARPARLQPASKTTLRVMGLFVPMLRELTRTYYQFAEPFVMDTSKFERAFGGFAATPLEEAVRATAQWYRQNAS